MGTTQYINNFKKGNSISNPSLDESSDMAEEKTTEEVENMMVRKAETLSSLEELNISAGTRAYLEKTFNSIDMIIWYGRCLSYDLDDAKELPEWKSELINAVKEAGFVRPKTDFVRSFRIGSLYDNIHECCNYIHDIKQLSNEQYENYVAISNEDIEGLKFSFHAQLSEKQYEAICQYYGLDGEVQSFEAIAQNLQVSSGYARALLRKAICYLRWRGTLPHVNSVTICEQSEQSKMPESTNIRQLHMLYGEYLERAGINTISDILCHKDDLHKIRGLGYSSRRKEIVRAMHRAGYRNFDIDT